MAARGGIVIGMLALISAFAACGPAVTEKTKSATTDAAAPTTQKTGKDETVIIVPEWPPLENDGLHDPANSRLSFLQQPREALSTLPPANEGNHVDWVAALRSGSINPRTNIYPETKIEVLDLDVLMEDTAGMPIVRFPHRPHTEWLDCKNCHDRIFIPKRGANPVNMFKVLQGEYCGQCHGAVSFPLTQCLRCHSVPRGSVAPQQSGVFVQ